MLEYQSNIRWSLASWVSSTLPVTASTTTLFTPNPLCQHLQCKFAIVLVNWIIWAKPDCKVRELSYGCTTIKVKYSHLSCPIRQLSILLLHPLSTHPTLTQDVCHTVCATLNLVKNQLQVSGKQALVQGLIQRGWIGWLATPLVCAVSIILFLRLSTLWLTFEQTILVNKVYDEMLIIHSDRE